VSGIVSLQLPSFSLVPDPASKFSRYNRHFADQWEFVEFAEKHLPDIDLKSPPKRPTRP
jgi:hypothetical protein